MKKSKTKKLGSALLSLSVLASFVVAAGCGSDSGKTVLEISPFNGGYGVEWLSALAEEYEAANPNVEVKFSKTVVNRANQLTELQSGVAYADIYFTGAFNIHGQLDGLLQNKLEKLDDVYENIGAKINPAVKDWLNHEGSMYAVPWATSVLGILYHKDFFAANNIQVPKTTNELFQVCDTINRLRGENKTQSYAFSYSGKDLSSGGCYWGYTFAPWMAQYETIEGYNQYYSFKDKEGTSYNSDYNTISSDYKGILRTLEVYEELLKPENAYSNHVQANDDDFTTAQYRFLDGQAQMMMNGDWIVQEMAKSGNYEKEETKDVSFMHTPIISSIVETMPMWKANGDEGKEYTSDPQGVNNAISDVRKAAYDKALSAIVAYVDGETTTNPAGTTVEGIGISQEDVDRIAKARKIVPTMSENHVAVIPTFSDQKEEAKKFLTFMYSDKGIETYSRNVYGTGLPVSYTNEQISEFVGDSNLLISAYEMLDGAEFTFSHGSKHYVFAKNNLTPTYRSDGKTYIEAFTTKTSSNKESAYTFYTKSQLQVIKAWDSLIKR